jgi:hypothetical protein
LRLLGGRWCLSGVVLLLLDGGPAGGELGACPPRGVHCLSLLLPRPSDVDASDDPPAKRLHRPTRHEGLVHLLLVPVLCRRAGHTRAQTAHPQPRNAATPHLARHSVDAILMKRRQTNSWQKSISVNFERHAHSMRDLISTAMSTSSVREISFLRAMEN